MSPSGETGSILSFNTLSSGSRTVYPKAATFSLDTFAVRSSSCHSQGRNLTEIRKSKNFIVRDFVESLSEGAGSITRRSGPHSNAFDPKPFIRGFEHAIARLASLSEERELHENELASAVRRAENAHRQHCATLQRKLDQALESFNSLENRIENTTINAYTPNVGGNVALEIGDKLEILDRQKRRAEDAKFLIHCWKLVSEKGDLSPLEGIRELGGSEGRLRCASIARQLLKISDRLHALDRPAYGDGEDMQRHFEQRHKADATARIEKFLERLEKDLLEQFDEANRYHNDAGMRDCATALYDFVEGASVIARYVNQHEFFLERSHLSTEALSPDDDIWEKLADPDSDPPGLEISLQSLVDEVKLVLEEESFTIRQIFPFRDQVLGTFIQRVFQQSIQQRLELVLEKAESVSSLAYLRMLQAARSYIGLVVEDVKSHGLSEHPEACTPVIAALLDQQLEELFVPYLTGMQYLEGEKRSLEELYGSVLFKFTIYHSKRRKLPTTYLGSLGLKGREMLSSARDAFVERLDSSELPSSQRAVYMQIAGLQSLESRDKTAIETTETDGALTIPVAKRMLKWLAEAIGRELELSGGSETPKNVSALTRILLVHIGDIYLDTALDAALETATQQESAKTEPELGFIADLQATISVSQLLLAITRSVLLPLAAPNVTVARNMEKAVMAFVTRIEDKIGAVESRTIDVLLSWTSKLLAKQNKGDFRPRDDSFGIEQLQTATCTSIFAFVSAARDKICAALDGRNAEAFFTEFAMGFRSLLLDHFKKFQVNNAGGLTVSQDVTKYIELLRSFPLGQSFLPSLEVLAEVGKIFVIGPEALKDRLRGAGGALTGVDRSELRPYILKRDDAGSVGVQAVLNAL